jgi:hypothetical protein
MNETRRALGPGLRPELATASSSAAGSPHLDAARVDLLAAVSAWIGRAGEGGFTARRRLAQLVVAGPCRKRGLLCTKDLWSGDQSPLAGPSYTLRHEPCQIWRCIPG